ncbi:MAG: AgmX/PglI C-terminal domain-containing protein [Bdellovibrionales bacterium]|nr:AgmX/PglI C-terminal domain-containing protein [Bdellovibrionales bacterium]
MENKSLLVLENTKGQVVRHLLWPVNSLVVVINQKTGRVEFVEDSSILEKQEIPHVVLAELRRDQLLKKDLLLEGRGRLRLVDHIDQVAGLVEPEIEDPNDLFFIGKWTLISHGVLLVLLLGASFILSRMQKEKEVTVTVFQQQDLPQAKVQTVKVADKKIEPIKQKAKVANKTVKVKKTTSVTRPKTLKKNSVSTQTSISEVGALGAFGGMNNGKKGSAGFNVNATNASMGTGLNKVGQGGAGGFQQAVHGQGLVSSPVGSGGVTGNGGYATRGKGGGRPGYGSMSMVGGSQGMTLPLEEEALVEGGLDKDQIAAVIQRNIGQILYCYEKGLQVQTHLTGRVSVRFVINPRGQVATAGINSSSLKSSSVEGCILNKLRGWQFPKPIGGVNVKVTYPFVLRRMS